MNSSERIWCFDSRILSEIHGNFYVKNGHEFGGVKMRGGETKILWTPPKDLEVLTLAFCQKLTANFTLKMKEKNSWGYDFGSVEMGVFEGLNQKIIWTPPKVLEALTLAFCQIFPANFTLKIKEKNSRGQDFGSAEMGVFRGSERQKWKRRILEGTILAVRRWVFFEVVNQKSSDLLRENLRQRFFNFVWNSPQILR